MRRALLAALIVVAVGLVPVSAQPPTRRATTLDSVRTYPGFYHLQTVVVSGNVTADAAGGTLSSESSSLRLLPRTPVGDGPTEITGTVYDIGRLNRDDPRIGLLGLQAEVEGELADRWPRPGEDLRLQVASARTAPQVPGDSQPALRALALSPARYDSLKVTVAGQFRGRNLFADLPDAPPGDRTDFVLRSGDGAVWVTGLRPRGSGFNFDSTRRVDTGRFLRVTGVVRQGRGLVWLEGASIELAEASTEETTEEPQPAPAPLPVEVIFASPSQDEVDVAVSTPIRLQFSRDLDPASVKAGIRLVYAADPGAAEPQGSVEVPIVVTYLPASRAVEIKPAGGPLERLRALRLELSDTVRGVGGGSLVPFTLTFTTGPS